MVDFQSRDRRRDTEDEADEPEPDEDDAEESTAESEWGETLENPEREQRPFRYAVVTVAANLTVATDEAGNAVVEAIEDTGAVVVIRDLIQPSYDGVQTTITTLANRDDIDAVVTIGGTGVEPADVTVDALDPLFDKQLPGFGELFRVLAHDREGTAVIGTRTTAGIVDTIPVFALPGSVDGATLGIEELVLAEARSLATDAHGDKPRN